MRVGIAADHGGYRLKEEARRKLREAGFEVVDFGAACLREDDDYPDTVIPLARAVAKGDVERGIAVCGSGVGACVAANKVGGVRAALIHEAFSARQGVEDDDMNLVLLRRPGHRRRPGMGAHASLPRRHLQRCAAAPPPAGESRGLGSGGRPVTHTVPSSCGIFERKAASEQAPTSYFSPGGCESSATSGWAVSKTSSQGSPFCGLGKVKGIVLAWSALNSSSIVSPYDRFAVLVHVDVAAEQLHAQAAHERRPSRPARSFPCRRDRARRSPGLRRLGSPCRGRNGGGGRPAARWNRLDHAADEIQQGLPLLVQVPVEPGELVVLAVGVVVALLRAADLVAAQQHRHALGKQQRGQHAPLLLLPQAR